MADGAHSLTITGLDQPTLSELDAMAKEHARSVESEARALLEQSVNEARRLRDWRSKAAERVATADRIAAMTPPGVAQTDSTILVREDRDRDDR